jgi:hypothetical protein
VKQSFGIVHLTWCLCHILDLGPHLDSSVSEHFPDSTWTHHYLCVNVYSLSLSFILLLYDFLS